MKLLGFIDEDPYDAATWSGSSSFFFSALDHAGLLASAHDTQPSVPAQWVSRGLCFHPRIATWQFRLHLDLRHYRKRTAMLRRHVKSVSADLFDGILQVGAWYDAPAVRDELLPGKFVASYHDGNLATLISSPFGHPPIARRHLERALSYERELYRRIDVIFPMSRWLAGSFERDNGVPADRIVPVGAGINLPYTGDTEMKTYERPEILFVGKQFERKGGPDLLAAFVRVREVIPDARLRIIGPQLSELPPGVECLGALSKSNPKDLGRLIDAYCEASVFVMPSLYEPFGIVLAEAMAHRLPCIGTNICAIPEIIQNEVTGFTVPVGDISALTDRLISLLSDPELCSQFGAAGYRRYQERFTWDAVVQKIGDALRRFG